MLGNFLTTLGNQPEEDHAMFEEQGLNVAAQPDNGSLPRPDNRAGWLEGPTPDPIGDHLAAAAEPPAITVTLWDPSVQLRYRKKTSVPPRPDQANNAWPDPAAKAGSPDQVQANNAWPDPAAKAGSPDQVQANNAWPDPAAKAGSPDQVQANNAWPDPAAKAGSPDQVQAKNAWPDPDNQAGSPEQGSAPDRGLPSAA
jgi:hypothetical protein